MSELVVRPLAEGESETLSRLAREIWLAHYPGIISREQIDYMLNERYSPAAIRAGMAGQCWRTAWLDGAMTGFAHGHAEEAGSWKLDKLYVHPRHQRQGIGRALVQAVAAAARAAGARRLLLRVNRHNTDALAAYARYGFRVYGEHVLDIGNGFVMDDYLLEMDLCS
jgi:ribosomal protein S18 acetylase RimI-like enzyme